MELSTVDYHVFKILKDNVIFNSRKAQYFNALKIINEIEVEDDDLKSKAEIELKFNVLKEIYKLYGHEYWEYSYSNSYYDEYAYDANKHKLYSYYRKQLNRLGIFCINGEYVYFGRHPGRRYKKWDEAVEYRDETYDERYCFTFKDGNQERLTYGEEDYEKLKAWAMELYGKPVNVTKRNGSSSYYLKHQIEDAYGSYVSNADCKKILSELGYKYKVIPGSPNWEFGIQSKATSLLDKYRDMYRQNEIYDYINEHPFR